MESISILNDRLLNDFGREDNGLPRWRIVFSDDQYEKRQVTHTPEGFELINPLVQLKPKYRQWIQGKYILERLLWIPQGLVNTDLVDSYSYEPVWTFEDSKGNPLPPRWDVITIIINSILQYSANKTGIEYTRLGENKRPRYNDGPKNQEEELEERKARISALQEELFGNETEVGDALAYKEGVTVPGLSDLETKDSGVKE